LRFVAFICAVAFMAGHPAAGQANSLSDFFRKLGNSMAHPQKHGPSTHKKSGKNRDDGSPTPTPAGTPVPGSVSEPTVRTAAVMSDSKKTQGDVPYGIPVADKPGFVTSPFSPAAGLVDVRGIPSGTAVKDPYTGKVFLTP
jgi:hypothetical protein